MLYLTIPSESEMKTNKIKLDPYISTLVKDPPKNKPLTSTFQNKETKEEPLLEEVNTPPRTTSVFQVSTDGTKRYIFSTVKERAVHVVEGLENPSTVLGEGGKSVVDTRRRFSLLT